MIKLNKLLSITLLFGICSISAQIKSQILNPVPFNEVTLEDNFWLPRLKTQKETLVPFALEKNKPAIENLEKTGNFLKGIKDNLPFPHRFISSDLYKSMEGAAYLLKLQRDPALEKQMDNIIDIIADAQKPDGYIYVAHTCGVAANNKYQHKHMGDTPYSYVIHSHELYNMGHMYEGAIAYFQATGKNKWLKVAEKNARHINRVFFKGDKNYNGGKPVNQAPGHEELELALVKLYRATGDKLYLEMAQKFIDIRGVSFVPNGKGVNSPEYAQQHKPVTEQRKAVGHAVRATYLYTGMADVASITGDTKYDKALKSIWHNIVDTRMHITGGLGAIHGIEGFGPEYLLPNKDAYNETCAAVGNVLFNYRMFLRYKDAKYIDVAEVSLYNNSLAGVNIEGNKFFYVNPLEVDGIKAFNHGRRGRSPWFGCACCPTNIARLIPQISGMMYAHEKDDIYLTFYGKNSTNIKLNKGIVNIKQSTNYPFDGKIDIKVNPEKNKQKFTLKLRIPTWLNKQFVPGDLYKYTDSKISQFTVLVNGVQQSFKSKKGYISIKRKWNKGDKVSLILPLTTRYNICDTRVKANIDRVSITRGPLVYCAEKVDNKEEATHYYITDFNSKNSTKTIEEGVLTGVEKISLPAKMLHYNNVSDENLKLIPFYAWNNRGEGSMNVWFPTKRKMVKYSRKNESFGGKFKKVKASFTCSNDDISAISDGKKPKNSADSSIPRWTSWPQKNKSQSIEITLKKETDIKGISVYWFEDKKDVAVPQNWSLQYYKNGKWVDFPIYVTDSYYTFKDQYNLVHPGNKITTSKIRINITPKKDKCIGVLDVNIDSNQQ